MNVSTALEALVACLVVLGAAFAFLGSLGLARFPDFYMRLHGPSKATTLGLGAVLAASMLWFAARGSFSFRELLVAAFVAITTPVSAHFLARAAQRRRVPQWRHETRDGGAADSRTAPGERT